MISLFAFTVYLCPPDKNSTASATRGVFLFWVPALLNRTLVASAPVSTTRFFLSAFGSKYPVRAEDRVPDRGSTARAGVKKPVALPVSCKSDVSCPPKLCYSKKKKRAVRTGFELVLAPRAFAAATDSSIRLG